MKRKAIIVLALGLLLLLVLGLYLTVMRGKVKEEEIAVPLSPSATTTEVPGEDEFGRLRESMVRLQIEARGVKDPQVLEAMRKIPRHEFVLQEYQGYSYADQPLPIGYGQTISQPYIVALMTTLL
ncbi:MAG: hypothetical protein MUP04_02085, partial [Anaerolineae bacterium]|nr:hypothetical protein [Anaerolineae bacterium]